MEKQVEGLLVSLGFDHPVIARQRLTKQLELSKKQSTDLDADLKKAKAAFEKAKKDQAMAKERLDEVQKSLDLLDGKKPVEEKEEVEEVTADEGEKKA